MSAIPPSSGQIMRRLFFWVQNMKIQKSDIPRFYGQIMQRIFFSVSNLLEKGWRDISKVYSKGTTFTKYNRSVIQRRFISPTYIRHPYPHMMVAVCDLVIGFYRYAVGITVSIHPILFQIQRITDRRIVWIYMVWTGKVCRIFLLHINLDIYGLRYGFTKHCDLEHSHSLKLNFFKYNTVCNVILCHSSFSKYHNLPCCWLYIVCINPYSFFICHTPVIGHRTVLWWNMNHWKWRPNCATRDILPISF